jgi:hypothetical protein
MTGACLAPLPAPTHLQRPLANVLRAALALGLWALMMTVATQNQDAAVRDAIHVILQLWACVTLFMTANLLKTLLAKLVASKLNKASHQQKMHDSLTKEYYLHMMLQPREREGAAGVCGSQGEEGEQHGEGGGLAVEEGQQRLRRSDTGSGGAGKEVAARKAPLGSSIANAVVRNGQQLLLARWSLARGG